MDVIIPLAGFGTRLRPHTFTRPKPLVNVAGKAVLGHVIDEFVEQTDTGSVVFIVGYLGEQIEEYVGQHYPQLEATYVVQEELNGQAPAILLARDAVSGPTLIVFVDTLADADLAELEGIDADGVIFVKEVEDPRRFGVVSLDDDGFIRSFIEKPDAMDNRLAVIGMYYVRSAERLMAACEALIASEQTTKGEYFLADAFNLMIADGARLRAQTVSTWLDCGTAETVLETNRALLAAGMDNSGALELRSCVVVPPVNIHPSARIEASVIGPNATIGEDCEISYSVIRDSVVDAGATVSDQVLASSLIGRDAVLTGRPRSFNIGDASVVGFDG